MLHKSALGHLHVFDNHITHSISIKVTTINHLLCIDKFTSIIFALSKKMYNLLYISTINVSLKKDDIKVWNTNKGKYYFTYTFAPFKFGIYVPYITIINVAIFIMLSITLFYFLFNHCGFFSMEIT